MPTVVTDRLRGRREFELTPAPVTPARRSTDRPDLTTPHDQAMTERTSTRDSLSQTHGVSLACMGDVRGVARHVPRTAQVVDTDGGFVAFGVLLGREHVLTCAEGLRADADLAVGFGLSNADGPGRAPGRTRRR